METMTVRILDCCSGTQSIERWVASAGLQGEVEVVSVDIAVVQGQAPTHLTDILAWDYEAAYPRGHFHVVWASPPCTQYSIARTTGPPRDLEGADRIVQRCLDIIAYFAPKVWIMENPAWGMLRTREVVRHLPNTVASYCQYGMMYRKDTRFWSNLCSDSADERNGLAKLDLKRCDPATCHAVAEGETRHAYQLSGEPARRMAGATKWNVGKVPVDLLEAMLGPVVRPHVGVHRFSD